MKMNFRNLEMKINKITAYRKLVELEDQELNKDLSKISPNMAKEIIEHITCLEKNAELSRCNGYAHSDYRRKLINEIKNPIIKHIFINITKLNQETYIKAKLALINIISAKNYFLNYCYTDKADFKPLIDIEQQYNNRDLFLSAKSKESKKSEIDDFSQYEFLLEGKSVNSDNSDEEYSDLSRSNSHNEFEEL